MIDNSDSEMTYSIFILFCVIVVLTILFFLAKKYYQQAQTLRLIKKEYASLASYFHLEKEENKSATIQKIHHFIKTHTFLGDNTTVTISDKVLVSTSLILMLKHTDIDVEDTINTIYITDKPRTKNKIRTHKSSSVVQIGNRFNIYINRQDLEYGFENIKDNKNLLIHQFAHIIDGLDGKIDGFPALIIPAKHLDKWNTLSRKYMNTIQMKDTIFNRQMLAQRSDFFASMSEFYFENPEELKNKYPEIFDFMEFIYVKSKDTNTTS